MQKTVSRTIDPRAFDLLIDESFIRQGDLINELKQRWDTKLPDLAREAGVPYHAARQRAHVAALVPPNSPLRTTGLSYSILRLLAPLPDPTSWAQHALALQKSGKLRVRQFAQLLVDAGLRRQRRNRSRGPCLHCDALVSFGPVGVTIRGDEGTGWMGTKTPEPGTPAVGGAGRVCGVCGSFARGGA